ncbi:hypothetical protein ACFJIV_05740 [Mucilaginibacter sp. UC70_90]
MDIIRKEVITIYCSSKIGIPDQIRMKKSSQPGIPLGSGLLLTDAA